MRSGKSPAAARRGSPRYDELIRQASLIDSTDELPDALAPLWGTCGARSVADLMACWCSTLDAIAPSSKRDLTGAFNIQAANLAPEDYQQRLLTVASRAVERGHRNSIDRAMQMSETLEIGESIFMAIDQWVAPMQEALRAVRSGGENAASDVLWAFMVRKGWTTEEQLSELIFGLAWLHQGVQLEAEAVSDPVVKLLMRSRQADRRAQ